MPNIGEASPRPYRQRRPDRRATRRTARIVCHCERVTAARSATRCAARRPRGRRSTGLRRRTRATERPLPGLLLRCRPSRALVERPRDERPRDGTARRSTCSSSAAGPAGLAAAAELARLGAGTRRGRSTARRDAGGIPRHCRPHRLRAARPAPAADRARRTRAGRGRAAGAPASTVRTGVSVTGWAGRARGRDHQPRRARAHDGPRRRPRHRRAASARGRRALVPGDRAAPASSRPGSCSRRVYLDGAAGRPARGRRRGRARQLLGGA